MTVRIYQSTDASAPTLNGTAGSVIALLDAVLVNGYGSLTAAGWTKSYSGTNLAAYRPPSGNQLYLRVDDTGAQEARLVGYETMSDVNTGTGPFPTAAQQSGGLYLRKSSTADATARPWVIIASATAFYFFGCPVETTATGFNSMVANDGGGHFFFGDLVTYMAGTDTYATMIIAPIATGGGSIGRIGMRNSATFNGTLSTNGGHFVARAYTQASGAAAVAKVVPNDYSDGGTLSISSLLPVFPDPCTGNLNFSVIEIMEQNTGNTYIVRGRLPGAFCPVHMLPGGTGDIVSGTGSYNGRSWFIVSAFNLSSIGRIAIELTNNW